MAERSRRLNVGYVLKNEKITDFEKKVYLAVLKIPKSEVRSYKWVAAKIGKPKAARAVGNALNKNPYIGIVPCHRVIKSNGSIGGFARGTKSKRNMLIAEGVFFRFKRSAGTFVACLPLVARSD